MNSTKKTMKAAAVTRQLREQLTHHHPERGGTLSVAALPHGENTLDYIQLKATFVAQVLESDEPGVKFKRTPREYQEVKITPLGEAWYNLARRDTYFAASDRLELGEAVKLFDEVSDFLDLRAGRFKISPLEQLQPGGPNEGEYLNGFIELLRARGRTQAYVNKVEKRQSAIKAQLRQLGAFVKRFPPEYNVLHGQWCHLTYKLTMSKDKAVTQREARKDMNRFLESILKNIERAPSVGQLWFAQFLPEVGYVFRVLLLFVPFDGLAQDDWKEAIQVGWGEATNQAGYVVWGRSVISKAAILAELKDFAAASEILSLPQKNAYPLCGFADTHCRAEEVQGVRARKPGLGEILGQMLDPLRQHPLRLPHAEPGQPILVNVVLE